MGKGVTNTILVIVAIFSIFIVPHDSAASLEDSIKAFEVRGEQLYKLGHYAALVDEMKSARSNSGGSFLPSQWKLVHYEALGLLQMKKYEEAISLLDVAISQNHQNPQLYKLRAQIYERIGDDSHASYDFGKALALGDQTVADALRRTSTRPPLPRVVSTEQAKSLDTTLELLFTIPLVIFIFILVIKRHDKREALRKAEYELSISTVQCPTHHENGTPRVREIEVNMTEVINGIVSSVYSFFDKKNTKAEMLRVLHNKKTRAKSDDEYIYSLVSNIGYYIILQEGTSHMIKHCLSNGKIPSLDQLPDVIGRIKAGFPTDKLYEEFKGDYLGKNAPNGMNLIDKLEFDYVFFSFLTNISQKVIEYLDEDVNRHITKYLLELDSENVVRSLDKEIEMATREFMNFYSPPTYLFAT